MHRQLRQFSFEFQQRPLPAGFPLHVFVWGMRPYSIPDFSMFLVELGIEVVGNPNSSCDAWVVGIEGVDLADLCSAIGSSMGRRIRIYSQEMLIQFLGSGRDPLRESRTTVLKFAKHPVLSYLLSDWTGWPSTDIRPSRGGPFGGNPPAEGMLREFGYHVGRSGSKRAERHVSLRTLFDARALPPVAGMFYVSEWGKPSSHERLMKMAETIAALARNAKRRDVCRLSDAIRDWEDDLDWLRLTYCPATTSRWPSSNFD